MKTWFDYVHNRQVSEWMNGWFLVVFLLALLACSCPFIELEHYFTRAHYCWSIGQCSTANSFDGREWWWLARWFAIRSACFWRGREWSPGRVMMNTWCRPIREWEAWRHRLRPLEVMKWWLLPIYQFKNSTKKSSKRRAAFSSKSNQWANRTSRILNHASKGIHNSLSENVLKPLDSMCP